MKHNSVPSPEKPPPTTKLRSQGPKGKKPHAAGRARHPGPTPARPASGESRTLAPVPVRLRHRIRSAKGRRSQYICQTKSEKGAESRGGGGGAIGRGDNLTVHMSCTQRGLYGLSLMPHLTASNLYMR